MMWWGLTPSLDLCSESVATELSVLLIAQTDCRHVFQTIAKRYRHPDCKHIKFYIYEPRLENVGRSLLFLSLLLDKEIGLGKKSQLFMDLFANSLIRPSTRQYLNATAQRLTKVITNFNYAEQVFPSLSLDSLKYKERDQLEHIFKFWSAGGERFDILSFWEERNRAHLGTRYDSRLGVYDWDLHMRYRPYGAEVVGGTEYKQFREKGLSFLQEDTDPCLPNVTLASFPAGSKSPACGYYGDIVTGPYPAFGLNSEEKDLLKKFNGQLRKTSSEISLWNIQQMIFEIENSKPYEPPKEDDSDFGVVRQDTSDQVQCRQSGDWRRPVECDNYSSCEIANSEIIILPTTALKDYPGKPQFRGMFDLVTVPQQVLNQLPDNFNAMLKPDALVLVESLKYALNIGKDGLAKAKTEADEKLKNLGGEPLGDFDYKKNDLIRYKIIK